MKEIIDELIRFRNDRDWERYHTPRNLAEAISIESGELLKCFIWGQDVNLENLSDEIADVAIFLLYLCDYFTLNFEQIIRSKIAKNNKKYPKEKRHEW